MHEYEIKERPVVFSDTLGRKYSKDTNNQHQKEYGQYLTPVIVADFMAGILTNKTKEKITVLDPGIGTGILTCAVCEKIIDKIKGLKEIHITGYEIDNNIITYTKESLRYLKEWLSGKNIICNFEIIKNDFIMNNSNVFRQDDLFINEILPEQKYDIIISNPPYFKINKNDHRSIVASKVVHGQPNLYSIFMALSAYLLDDDGDLVFITPRSYTSGNYFKAFRNKFFSEIIPKRFHLFGSRKEAFARDDVLQEHLIIHGTKRTEAEQREIEKIIISFSYDTNNLDTMTERQVFLKDVIDFKSNNKYIFLPLTEEEEDIIAFVNGWNGNLHKYNMEISTGKVIPFRAASLLFKEVQAQGIFAPLIWMNHIQNGHITWPLAGWHKEQYVAVNKDSLRLLVPDSHYVLMRRFSPKEDLKRINTAPLTKNQFKYELLGIENHINYIHRPGGELSLQEIYGLSAILNSRYLDIYFRTLNGNTEVSATEIRDIPLPDYDLICWIGAEVLKNGIENINVEMILTTKKVGAA